jgi:hypothetical protein
MIKFQTNYKRNPSKGGEQNSGEKVTVENDALTIKEIMHRAMKGLTPDYKEIEYIDIDNIENIDEFRAPFFDLTQKEAIDLKIQALKDEYNDAITEAKAKALAEKIAEDKAEETNTEA